MGYKIGSFNLKNIGEGALCGAHSRDIAKIVEIIKAEGFDVVALQEVLSEGKAFTVHPKSAEKSFLGMLGPKWKFKWANADAGMNNDKRDEGYAFLWNTAKLDIVETETPKGTRRFQPRMLKMKTSKPLTRHPYYARFQPTDGARIELRLICIHNYFGNGESASKQQRQDELRVLLTEIYPQKAHEVYGNNMPQYTILLGDYNLCLKRDWKTPDRGPFIKTDQGDAIIIKEREKEHHIITVQDQLTSLKRPKDGETFEKGDKIRGYAHDYDHFSYEIEQFEGTVIHAKRVDAVQDYYNNDFKTYHEKVSDHSPIIMSLELKDVNPPLPITDRKDT